MSSNPTKARIRFVRESAKIKSIGSHVKYVIQNRSLTSVLVSLRFTNQASRACARASLFSHIKLNRLSIEKTPKYCLFSVFKMVDEEGIEPSDKDH